MAIQPYTYIPQRKSGGFRPFWRKWYLLVPFYIFFVLAFLAAWIIAADEGLHFSSTKTGIDDFITTFQTPIWLLGVAGLAISLALAFHRSENSDAQIVHTNYLGFRQEFMDLWTESEYKPQQLILSPSSLFSALYPNARAGDWSVEPKFVAFIYKKTWGFREGMQQLTTKLEAPDHSKFIRGCYDFILGMRGTLIAIIPINYSDAEINLAFMAGHMFTGEKATLYIGLAKDIFHIVSIVNDMGKPFFTDSEERHRWRRSLYRLEKVKKESEQLIDYIESDKVGEWRALLTKKDFDTFRNFNVLEGLEPNFASRDDVKRFLFHSFRQLGDEESLRVLADKLGLPYPAENAS